MVGIAEQYQYILRDESIHLNFGIDVINQIRIENPELRTKAFQEEVRAMVRAAAKNFRDVLVVVDVQGLAFRRMAGRDLARADAVEPVGCHTGEFGLCDRRGRAEP